MLFQNLIDNMVATYDSDGGVQAVIISGDMVVHGLAVKYNASKPDQTNNWALVK